MLNSPVVNLCDTMSVSHTGAQVALLAGGTLICNIAVIKHDAYDLRLLPNTICVRLLLDLSSTCVFELRMLPHIAKVA